MESEIRITYCITEELDTQAVRSAVEHLSNEERRRCSGLRHERHRRDFAIAHALLRRTLSACGTLAPGEWRFTRGAHGKPLLADDLAERERLSFNLAHTDGLVACCVARDAEVGIDVETISRTVDIHGIAARFFSPAEAADLERCPEPGRRARFTELWTLKEAYVKARGDGLACPLDRFAFRLEDPGVLRFEAPSDDDLPRWSFALFAPTGSHRLAVAVNSRIATDRSIEVHAVGVEGALPEFAYSSTSTIVVRSRPS